MTARRRSRSAAALAVAFGVSLPAAACAGAGAMDAPLSARQQAGGGVLGEPDILGVPGNPAMLTAQATEFDANAGLGYLFESAERIMGLGAGWVNGSPKELAWGIGAVYAQVTTKGFDETDDVGNPTGNRVSPSARRFDAFAAAQRGWAAVGLSAGTASESYGSLPDGIGDGPSGSRLGAGILATFDRWRAGISWRRQSLDAGGESRNTLEAGGSIVTGGLRISGDLTIPFSGLAGPALLAGVHWPVLPGFDLRAAYADSFAEGVGMARGGSVRAGASLQSRGMGLDYCLVLPVTGGMGATHLLAVGYPFGSRAAPPAAAKEGI